jgi:cytochrome c biogenesis protein CcmG/thiol:disulfide interchange protein DsbE
MTEPSTQAPAPPPRMVGSRRAWIAVAVVVALIAAAVAVNRFGTTKPGAGATPNRAKLVAAAALPDCPAATAPKASGGLPAITLPCLGNGPKVDLAKLRGPLLLNVWAGTCPPCRAEAPALAAFAAKTKGRITVLGVVDGAYEGETWDDALDASRGLALHYPSVFDSHGNVPDALRTAGIPLSVLVDAGGHIVFRHAGQMSAADLAAAANQYFGISVS